MTAVPQFKGRFCFYCQLTTDDCKLPTSPLDRLQTPNTPGKQKRLSNYAKPLYCMAGEQGFEPWLAESESAVLPLDDSPK